MEKVLNKFYDFIDKIGKPNFIFLVFIIFIILVTGLYQTFSLFTSTDGTSIIDGILTYKFILNNDNTENSITIAADNTKNIMLTISNPETLNLKYGIYYSSSDDLTNVSLGYLSSSEHKATETIASKNDYIIKLKVNNASSSDVTIKFGISYGLETGGDLQLDTGKHWLGEYSPYKETLEYLETDGLGYIDTGFYPNQDTKIEFTATPLVNNSTVAWFGAREDYFLNTFTLWQLESNNFRGDYEIIQKTVSDLAINANTKYTISMGQGKLIVNNTQYVNWGEVNFQSPVPLILFSVSSKNVYADLDTSTMVDNRRAKLWFYSSKIYDNGTLVRDYIPVKDMKGVSCLYDKVTEELYYLKQRKQRTRYLSEALVGSYVKYTGTNGCSGKSCEGQNANYVSNSNMGYCYETSYKFNSNGWRVAYINDGTAYLTSGGSPECMCTDSSGNAGTGCGSTEETVGAPKHLANLNTKALTYCNSTYAYGGICNSSSAWNMNDADFQKITGDTLETASNKDEGYYDDYAIINNGSYYWFATSYDASSAYTFSWYPSSRYVSIDSSSNANGVRPVLRLKSSVIVTGGSGTMTDPYVISNG